MAKSPVTEFALDPSLFPDHQQPSTLESTATLPSSPSRPSIVIRERERNQLRVVAQGLAPELVLDQPLSVPDAPTTFRNCLSSDSKLLPISVLRACLNEASTNALFSSATSLDSSPEETTRLLNEVDSFQSTLLGLLDEVERRYTLELQTEGSNDKVGVKKRELQDATTFNSNRTKKYMLHRGGANGGDLFTSAAFLSENDLQQVSMLNEADLVAVHSTTTTTTTSSSHSTQESIAPSLGSIHPPFLPPSTHLPISTKFSLAPGQSPALAPTLPPLIPPVAPRTSSSSTVLKPLSRETRMLDYGVWNSGSTSLRFDSLGSTDGGYTRAANRLVGRERVKKYDKEFLLPSEPLRRIRFEQLTVEEEEEEKEGRGEKQLTIEEKKVLQGLEIDLQEFLEFTNRFERDEQKVWKVLENNLELINRLAGQQIGRVRKSVKKEEKKRKQEIKKRGSSTLEGGAGGDSEDTSSSSSSVSVKRDIAEGVEKQDADTLLDSLTSLLSSFYKSSILPSISTATTPTTTTTTTSPSLLPSPSLIRSLTPLIVSELHREASYYGALEPLEGNDFKTGWEKAVKESSTSGGGGGGIKQE
ncbi:hypothetical protein JCM5350_002624 [Sporobolomyces pararoseus]